MFDAATCLPMATRDGSCSGGNEIRKWSNAGAMPDTVTPPPKIETKIQQSITRR